MHLTENLNLSRNTCTKYNLHKRLKESSPGLHFTNDTSTKNWLNIQMVFICNSLIILSQEMPCYIVPTSDISVEFTTIGFWLLLRSTFWIWSTVSDPLSVDSVTVLFTAHCDCLVELKAGALFFCWTRKLCRLRMECLLSQCSISYYFLSNVIQYCWDLTCYYNSFLSYSWLHI